MYILSNNKIKASYDCPICGYYCTDFKTDIIETTTYADEFRTYKAGDTLYFHGKTNFCRFSRTEPEKPTKCNTTSET